LRRGRERQSRAGRHNYCKIPSLRVTHCHGRIQTFVADEAAKSPPGGSVATQAQQTY
jgi:hypothetical protein